MSDVGEGRGDPSIPWPPSPLSPLSPKAPGPQELGKAGFRIVIFPGGTARAVAHTLRRYYGTLQKDGTTAAMRGEMLDFDGLNALIGTPELLEAGKRYE